MSMEDTTTTLFTIKEVAQVLKCDRQTVKRAINDGDIRAAVIGRRSYRVSREELNRYFKAKGGGRLF